MVGSYYTSSIHQNRSCAFCARPHLLHSARHRAEVFDAHLGWWIVGYNHRRLRALGKKVPPDTMPPKVCEHYIAHGLCTDFPDWTIAAPGSEDSVKISYDYGRLVTGEEQQVELALSEEAV